MWAFHLGHDPEQEGGSRRSGTEEEESRQRTQCPSCLDGSGGWNLPEPPRKPAEYHPELSTWICWLLSCLGWGLLLGTVFTWLRKLLSVGEGLGENSGQCVPEGVHCHHRWGRVCTDPSRSCGWNLLSQAAATQGIRICRNYPKWFQVRFWYLVNFSYLSIKCYIEPHVPKPPLTWGTAVSVCCPIEEPPQRLLPSL